MVGSMDPTRAPTPATTRAQISRGLNRDGKGTLPALDWIGHQDHSPR